MDSRPDPLARVPAAMRPPVRRALSILLEAFDSAAALQGNPWDMAVPITELRSARVRAADLRWLITHGYVQAAVEETEPGANLRVFGPLGGKSFPAKTCFVLTEAG